MGLFGVVQAGSPGWSVARRAVHPHSSTVPAERSQAGAFPGAVVEHSAASVMDVLLLVPAQTVGPGQTIILGLVSACKAALSGCP